MMKAKKEKKELLTINELNEIWQNAYQKDSRKYIATMCNTNLSHATYNKIWYDTIGNI